LYVVVTPLKLHLGMRGWFVLAFLCAPAMAAPMLRLSTSALVWLPGGRATQTVCASNAGDGTLATSVSVPSGVKWLTVSVGALQPCLSYLEQSVSIQFTIGVSSLPRGTYTASVTVSDPHAIDAPQVVTATAQVGGGDPIAIDQYIAPGRQGVVPIYTGDNSFSCPPGCPSVTASTQDGGTWLAVAYQSAATFTYSQVAYIHLAPPASMAPGTYSGSVAVNSYAIRTIPVTMRVTTQPIAMPSTSQIHLRLAEGGPAAAYPFLPPISLTNLGMGTLEVQGVAATGEGVSAYQYGGLAVVTVDPESRGPGTYNDGVVTIQCNGANCPVRVPVSLEVVPRAPPAIAYQGVVDNVTFGPGFPVAPDDVCVVRGEQLSMSAPASAAGFPLPTSLGGATVLVNDVLAPLFYTSFGQIAFQMPYGTATGTALVQVERDEQISNTVTVNLVARAPQILAVTDTAYQLRDANHPTKVGETLILWAIGLGATNPPVAAGVAAPLSPPAVAVNPPRVLFNSVEEVTPSFAGLSGGSAGLYQLIVTVPLDMRKGVAYVQLDFPNWYSPTAPLVVQ
jgi:uncharacterized protein (TIGR03437 family)